MGTSRRQSADDVKREAVGLLASSGRPLSQIAEELGWGFPRRGCGLGAIELARARRDRRGAPSPTRSAMSVP